MLEICRYVLAATLMIFSVAGQALAAPASADAQKIDACLTAAAEKDQFGTACIGLVADPCIEAAKGKNTDVADAKACAARELAVWTARLQKAINESKAGGKEFAATVANAQASWSSSLQRLCPVFDKLDPGMALGAANYCRLQETAMRALTLERLAAAVNPH
jgi:lysozyme inhibitor LprI